MFQNDSGASSSSSYGAGPERPDYKAHEAAFKAFMQSYRDAEGAYKYTDMLQEVANRRRKAVPIHLDDLRGPRPGMEDDRDLLRSCEINTMRYYKVFSSAIDAIMPQPDEAESVAEDVYDVLHRHRLQQQQSAPSEEGLGMDAADPGGPNPFESADGSGGATNQPFPDELMRRYEIQIVPRSKMPARSLREVKADDIGALVKIKGIVTRVSAVKPIVTVATYTCDSCGYEHYEEVKSRTFTLMDVCPRAECQKSRNKGRIFMQRAGASLSRARRSSCRNCPTRFPWAISLDR